ncbi:MAG TPA: hypothetical protein VK014_05815, partial [Cyclobacteriaceae bacterium]|nr:hypothetical protein [Cyclobacteriaceae bacterium]
MSCTNVQLEQANHENHAKRKKLADGRISLYIESFKGSTVDEKTGKRVHLRDFEFLKPYLHPNPKTAREKKDNKEALQLAEDILALRKSEFLQGRYGFKNKSKANRPFLDYYVEKMEEKSDSVKNYGVWESAYYHL